MCKFGYRFELTNAICLTVFVLTYEFVKYFTVYMLLLGIGQI